ncbi:protease propeptide/inhibitor [Crassisporium funariophilum]|nr:protease propeptide/inhibitor [Crassisporium funariophilum]
MSNRYIVVFKNGVTKEQIDQYVNNVNKNGGEVGHRWDSILNGFSATLPESFLMSLQNDELIEYIEPDGIMTTQ